MNTTIWKERWQEMAHFTSKSLLAFVVLSLWFVASAPARVEAETPPEVDWVEGPTTVSLGDVGEIKLGENYVFLNAEDTKEVLKYLGEADPLAVGYVAPKAKSQDWSIFFSYDPMGYVKDDEKESMDSDAILESIKKGTEQANKTRIQRGFPALNVIGWYEKPHYDANSHDLVWVVLAEEADTKARSVNYNTRLLGRNGVMAVILVSDPETLAASRPYLDDVIAHFSWKKGKSYAEWRPGDKVAEIGLTALAAGGAGALAAKTGLLAKIWKFLVFGVIALMGAMSGLIKHLRGRRRDSMA